MVCVRVQGQNVLRLLWLKDAAGVTGLHYLPEPAAVFIRTKPDTSFEWIQQLLAFWVGGGVTSLELSDEDYTLQTGDAPGLSLVAG